jgi:hypothetical protein
MDFRINEWYVFEIKDFPEDWERRKTEIICSRADFYLNLPYQDIAFTLLRIYSDAIEINCLRAFHELRI